MFYQLVCWFSLSEQIYIKKKKKKLLNRFTELLILDEFVTNALVEMNTTTFKIQFMTSIFSLNTITDVLVYKLPI